MPSKHSFPYFDTYVLPNDHVQFYHAQTGITFRATLYRDDASERPDERDDGFWPSLDPHSAGYIGARNLAKQTAKAQRVMDAWLADEWFYCGVAVTAHKAGVQLTPTYHNALWGIEANYPSKSRRKSKHPNSYLRTVAQELLDDCFSDALAKLQELAQ